MKTLTSTKLYISDDKIKLQAEIKKLKLERDRLDSQIKNLEYVLEAK